MKRIISVLILLAAIILAGYFSTGLVTERTLIKNLSTLNQADFISADLAHYQRGLFTSSANLVWRIQTPEKIRHQDDGRSMIVPPKSYTFDMPLKIYHGPVMFKAGHVRLGLGMVEGELLLPSAYQHEFSELFSSASTQPKLKVDAFVSYMNKTKLQVALLPFKLLSKDIHKRHHVEWLGMHSSLMLSPAHSRVQADVVFDGLRLVNDTRHVVIDKTTTACDLHKTEHGFYLGQASLELSLIQFTDKANSKIVLKQLHVNSDSDERDDRLSTSLHVAFERLFMNDKTYGPVALNILAKNLDADVLAHLNDRASQLQHAGMHRAEAQQALLSLLPDVPQLLSRGAVFELKTLRIALPEGALEGALRVAFPEAKADAPLQLLPRVAGEGVFKFPASFVRSLLIASYKQRLNVMHDDVYHQTTLERTTKSTTENSADTQAAQANLDQQATHQAEQKLAGLIQAGALQVKGSDYVLELQLSAGRLLVNGHPFHAGMLNF